MPRFEHICLFADFPATCFRFEPGLGVQELNLGPPKSPEGWSKYFVCVSCGFRDPWLKYWMCTAWYCNYPYSVFLVQCLPKSSCHLFCSTKQSFFLRHVLLGTWKCRMSVWCGGGGICRLFQLRRNSLRDWEDVPIYEPCTQSYWSLKASWTRKHLRGCILGRSFHLYQENRMFLVASAVISREQPPRLTEQQPKMLNSSSSSSVPVTGLWLLAPWTLLNWN